MKFFLILLILPLKLMAQDVPKSMLFWNTLEQHCGKAYEGKIIAGGKEGDGFLGEKLVMHVRSCNESTIRIPFFVGEDKSRTWVFSMSDTKRIQLKHDHRHKDGSEDEITQYGGTARILVCGYIQFFPAGQETSNLIPYASNNIWWVTIDTSSFTYNLRRIGTDRLFSVKFDLTKEVKVPSSPWGSED